MGSDLRIRPFAFPTDIPKLRAFVQAEAESMNIPDAGVGKRLDEFLASASVPWDVFLVAEVGRQFAGFAIIRTDAKFSASHKGVLRIQVGEPHRGDGVGSALLEAALEWADEQGLVRVEATPHVGDEYDEGGVRKHSGKLAFFRDQGFRWEGRLRKAARLRDGGYSDVAMLARVI